MAFDKKITVLMPIYNADDYLEESIKSILNQTYTDFDLLAIDDGSTDNSAAIIHSFQDDRVHYLKNEKNMGIVPTLNRGLALIEGPYIVRMDSDDICLPTRFEEQIKFMDQYPEVAVSGTSIEIFTDDGKVRKKIVKTNPATLRTQLIFEAALMHPSVIIRNDVIKKEQLTYDINHKATEDIGLWQKIAFKYDLANIPSIQLRYRDNEFGITRTAEKDTTERDQAHMNVYRELFDFLGVDYQEQELKAYRAFLARSFTFSGEELPALASIFSKIKAKLQPAKFDLAFFDEKASSFLRNNCLNHGMSYGEFVKIHQNYFADTFQLVAKEKTKFIIKKILMKK